MARQMAKELNYVYVDTGAMYRAITLYFIRQNTDINNPDEVAKALREIELDFRYNENSGQADMHLNDENVEYMIRDLIVAEKVSEVATIKAVREFAVAAQQKMGAKKASLWTGATLAQLCFPMPN